MKIETQRQDDCTLTLTIEVDDERLQPALRAAAREFSRRYRVPGFRPGKAPYDVIVRQFGEEALYETAVQDLGQKVYAEALDQEKLEAFGPGSLEDVQFKPLRLKFTVPLKPEVELGDYRALRLPFTPAEVPEQTVQEQMERSRERRAVMEPVSRSAALGDVLQADVKGFLNTGENPSDFLLADEDVSLLLEQKTDWPMPGFAMQLLGLSAGDERKFDLTFADDYANESLRGQTAHFEVRVKEVKSRTLPEWSDELARDLGGYESLDAMRAAVRAELEKEASRSLEHDYHHKVVDELVGQASVKYPPNLLASEVDDLLEDLDRRLREQKLTLDDYLKIESKTRDALREEFRPRAEERLKRSLALTRVIELEKLKVGPDEVEARIAELVAPFGENSGRLRELFSGEAGRRSLELELLSDRAVERLAALARGEDVPLPPADEPAPEAALPEDSPVQAAEA